MIDLLNFTQKNRVRIVLFILLAVVLIVPTPVLAEENYGVPITVIFNDVVIHADDDVKQIGYTVNGKANLAQVIVPAGEVEIKLNKTPEGNAFVVVYRIGNNEPTESRVNPATVTVPPTSDAITIDVYLSLATPLPKPQGGSSSQGSSVILTQPPAIVDDITGTIHGIYTAHVENGGAANFPETLVVYRVIMPEEYSGNVTLTTYTNVRSTEDTDIYHLCDISIEGNLPNGTHALVLFKIPVSVIQAHGYSLADVCLYHYENGKWMKCPTVYEVIGDMVYYEATVYDFSPFIVVFEKNAATPKGEAVPTETETQSPLSVACVLAGLAAVVLLCRRR